MFRMEMSTSNLFILVYLLFQEEEIVYLTTAWIGKRKFNETVVKHEYQLLASSILT